MGEVEIFFGDGAFVVEEFLPGGGFGFGEISGFGVRVIRGGPGDAEGEADEECADAGIVGGDGSGEHGTHSGEGFFFRDGLEEGRGGGFGVFWGAACDFACGGLCGLAAGEGFELFDDGFEASGLADFPWDVVVVFEV